MDESVQRQTRGIANNAITEISRISQLMRATHTETSTGRISSTLSPSGSASSACLSQSESGASSGRSGSLLSETTPKIPEYARNDSAKFYAFICGFPF